MSDSNTNEKVIDSDAKSDDKRRRHITRGWIILIAVVALVVVFIVMTILSKRAQATYTNESRYTYEASISDDGSSMTNEDMASVWINGYLSQYNEMFTPTSERLKNIKVTSVNESDADNGTVRMDFSASLADSSTQYFNDWGGSISGGTIRCSWLGAFGIKQTVGGYVVYPISITQISDNNSKSPTIDESDDGTFVRYRVFDNTLSVSYDAGDSYTVVPVDIRNLPLTGSDYDTLQKKSYILSEDMVAFLYGGETVNGERTPLSIIYSVDSGQTWETGEIDSIFDIDLYYIDMFSETDGIIAIGYGVNNNTEYTKIYKTTDGARAWTNIGSGPSTELLKGIRFISMDVGFITYDNENGNNLYMTRDGAKTFTPISFPAGTLDETAGGKQWFDIFKVVSVPAVDVDGNIVVYLTQQTGSNYHGGTAAVYSSSDEGLTWKFVEEISYTTE